MSRICIFACACSLLCPWTSVIAQQKGATPELFAASKAARDSGRYGMLLRQFRAVEPTLGEHSEVGFWPAMPTYQQAHDIPAGHWVWAKPCWFVFRDGPGSEVQSRPWGPEQACGAPDTGESGDHGTAWASKEQDARDEWLLLEYSAPVRIAALEVHETFNPGAIAAVSIFTAQGEEVELWRNKEPAACKEQSRVLHIDVPLGFEVERVKLHLRSDAVPGWNEIDAVGLKDDKGKVHWAARAEASSTYAEGSPQVGPMGNNIGGGRIVFQGPWVIQAQANVLDRKGAIPVIQWALQPKANAVAVGEKATLEAQIKALEAKVAALEAELARAKAARRDQ